MIKTLAYTLASRAVVVLSALLSLVVSTQFLGPEAVGLFNLLVVNIAIVHTLTEIYTGSGLAFFIPRVNTAILYRNGLIWIIAVVALSSVVLYFQSAVVKQYVLHLVVLSLLGAINNFHSYLLLGKAKLSHYNWMVIMQPAINVISLLVFVLMTEWRNVNAAIAALYIAYSITFMLSFLFIRKIRLSDDQQTKPVWRQIFSRGITNQLGNLAHLLSNRFNYYIIASISIGLLGVYSSGTSLIESVLTVSAAISPVVLARVANSTHAESEAKTSLRLANYSLLLSACLVAIIVMVPTELFGMILGKNFSGVKEVMLWLSPGVLAISFSSVLSHYFSGRGMQKVLLTANVSGMVTTIALSYFFVSTYGLKGACITASIAYAVQCAVISWTFFKEQKN